MKLELLKHSFRDNRNVMEYQTQPGEMMEGPVLKQFKEGKIPGVLMMGAAYEDGRNYMYAYVDDKDTFAGRLEDVVTQELILTSFESIVSTLIRMDEAGINLAYAVLDTKGIYIDDEAKKARLVCMPTKNATSEVEQLPEFFRNILANAVYLNSDDGNYVAKLLTAVNREFEFKSFLRTLHGLMMDAGIEIVEETIEEEPVEPVVAEPVAMPVVEPIVAEPIVEAMAEPIVAEPVVEAMAEPVVAEPVVEPMAEPVAMPVVEPVAEPVAPATPVMPEVPVQPVVSAAGVIVEDEIEFEPMPEELSAKIERMNAETTAPVVEPVVAEPVAAPIVEPVVAEPVAMPVVEPVVAEPVAMPVVEPVATPVAEPVVAPAPGPVVTPSMSPQPLITPEAAGLKAPKVPSPHLIRSKTGERIDLPDTDFIIGKSQIGVNYTVTDNSAVSRVHCTITRKNGAFYIRDEKSTNCTYVNGEQVLPGTEKLLLNNCKIVLGDEEFTYSLW